jgi:outer membrane protein assembly factor BamB
LDPGTGVQLWVFNTSSDVAPGCTLDGSGTLFVGDAHGVLYALQSTTGRLLWSFTASSSIITAPSLGPGGVLYIITRDYDFFHDVWGVSAIGTV